MKKRLLLWLAFGLLEILSINSESATWVMAGGGYCTSFENASRGSNRSVATMNSIDVMLEYHIFHGNSMWGLFYRFDFLIPTFGSHTLSGIAESNDVRSYDRLLGFMTVIGPAFRFPISNNLDMEVGIGASWTGFSGYFEKHAQVLGNIRYSMFSYSFGVSADIGVGIHISDSILLMPGTSITYCFASHSSFTENGTTIEGWASKYSGLSVSPYIHLAIRAHAI
ncbi:MAG: hypothetical protein ABSB63_01695 [Spirochaetia bacterium]